MKTVDKLEDTLNGCYHGLYGEVVTEDIYRVKKIKFKPDIIFDLGANVGIFTRFCRSLFPEALIISVEPDEENFAHLNKFTPQKGIIKYNKAIGIGKVWRCIGAANGAHEVYINAGLGYPKKLMGNKDSMTESKVDTIMPDKLIGMYWQPGMKSIVKIDVEGNEHTIFTHKHSMQILKLMDYIAMEVHFYALTAEEHKEVKIKTHEYLKEFEKTHTCELDVVNFWATKKV